MGQVNKNYAAIVAKAFSAEELVYRFEIEQKEGEIFTGRDSNYDFLIVGEKRIGVEVKYREKFISSDIEIQSWAKGLRQSLRESTIDEGRLYIIYTDKGKPRDLDAVKGDLLSENIYLNTYSFDELESKLNILKSAQKRDFLNELSVLKTGKKYSNKYERLIVDCLSYLFDGRLNAFFTQKKLNDGLIRADCVARISMADTKYDGVWKLFLDSFNSKYIVFEFKNYTKKITQAEVLTTEKYLYPYASRSVAFIFSRKGADVNAQKTMNGAMREAGKLILSFSDEDLIKLLGYKASADESGIEEFLYAKVDDFLLSLGR